MSEPTPYRIYISEETIKRLNKAATETGKESGNKVAAAIVSDCLDVWLALQKSLRGHREEYLQGIIAAIEGAEPKQKR